VKRRSPRADSPIHESSSGPALVAHIDGGARGNPGPAGYGVHVEVESDPRAEGGGSDRPLAELFGYLGIATNNTAEYAALLALLEFAKGSGARSLRIFSDSELLVRQMRGEYRVKDPKLKVLHAAARSLAASLPRVVLEHVPREENREADALANRAMDSRESSGPLPAALRDLPRAPAQNRLL
jgi:ribonuclease HI